MPIWRVFAATMSDSAMQHLMHKSPDYFRRPPRPVAETDTIAQNVFLDTTHDIVDIVADVRKVDRDCLERASRAGTCQAV